MAKLPIISGKKAVTAFKNAGWNIERRAKGSHIIMKKPGMKITLSVPDHKTVDRGLLRSLIRDACLSIDQFNELLKK